MLQRGGNGVIRMLANVQQTTIQPLIQATIRPDTLIDTDEYDIYARLPEWGYGHQTVCHSRGEYARDEDGDEVHEVHVNAIERILVAVALLVASPPRHFPRKVALISGVLPIRS
jgi:transposase